MQKAIDALVQAKDSFENAKLPGYSAENWHLNASMCVDIALKALQSQPAADGWISFDSAPKDGTEILAWVGENWNGRMPFVRTSWFCGYWRNEFYNGSMPDNFNPAWWRPILPQPPAATKVG